MIFFLLAVFAFVVVDVVVTFLEKEITAASKFGWCFSLLDNNANYLDGCVIQRR